MSDNPLRAFLDRQGFVVLDGGLATEMEARGRDLGDDLWSARVLLDEPALVSRVHSDYLKAGADCIVSATYQATTLGFMRRGLSEIESMELLRLATRLAVDARDEFWRDPANRTGRIRPLVAASVGPYGAYLADGSEYTGTYRLSERGLYDFHRDRWHLLAQSGADLLACETIPSLVETRSLARLLQESGDTWAWISFSCDRAGLLRDGSSLEDAVAVAAQLDQVLAVGVNCVPPGLVSDLIVRIRSYTEKPIVVYPNKGEGWDAGAKRWLSPVERVDLGVTARGWLERGASLVGGCCRTGPSDVKRIRASLCGVDLNH